MDALRTLETLCDAARDAGGGYGSGAGSLAVAQVNARVAPHNVREALEAAREAIEETCRQRFPLANEGRGCATPAEQVAWALIAEALGKESTP